MKDEDLISAYLLGKLNVGERVNFEKRLNSDSSFAERFEFIKNVKIASRKIETDDFEKILLGIKKERQEQNESNRNKWILVAASLILVIGVSGWWFLRKNTIVSVDPNNNIVNTDDSTDVNDNVVKNDTTLIDGRKTYDVIELSLSNKLFAEYFELPEIESIFFFKTFQSSHFDIRSAYRSKRYRFLINEFKKREKKHESDPVFRFYYSTILLGGGEADTAIIILQEDEKQKDKFDAQRQWYLALAYLKKSDFEKSKSLLNSLIDLSLPPAFEGNYNQQKAKELYNKISKYLDS